MASPIRQDGGATSDSFGRSVDLSDTLGFHDVDFDTQRPRPYSSEVHVEYDAMSHTGHVRENNEDAFLVYRVSRSWERLLTNLPEGDLPGRFDENAYVFCVADGMGGVAAGDVASSLALRTGVNLVLNSVKWSLKVDHPESRQEELRELVARALDRFRRISRTIAQQSADNPALAGMGTTLTVAGSFGADLFVFHVGDSRVYLFRHGELEQLTRDQTVVQAYVDSGYITPDQAKTHRLRHVLTGVLGGRGDQDTPEVQMLRLLDGDKILLCTDGLTEMLDDGAIGEVLGGTASPSEACRRLVDRALGAGGRDNISVVVARYSLPTQD
jgi:PPM family protein phosphatase